MCIKTKYKQPRAEVKTIRFYFLIACVMKQGSRFGGGRGESEFVCALGGDWWRSSLSAG